MAVEKEIEMNEKILDTLEPTEFDALIESYARVRSLMRYRLRRSIRWRKDWPRRLWLRPLS